MNLHHIHKGLLIMFAGEILGRSTRHCRKVRPGQISQLAEGFHMRVDPLEQADNAFTDARNRLNAWTHDNGQHPITDSRQSPTAYQGAWVETAQRLKLHT